VTTLKLSAGVAFLLLSGAAYSRADVLDFSAADMCSANNDGSGPMAACVEHSLINQAYGDSATANVTYIDEILGTPPGSQSLQWWDGGYNTLPAAIWGGSSDAYGDSWDEIVIAPAGGSSGITLNSFVMGVWGGNDLSTTLQILDLGTSAVLVDYGSPSLPHGYVAPATYAPDITSADGLIISWKNSGYNVGIDDVDFTSTPEPAAWSLLAAGLGALAWVARRRQSA